MIIHPIKVDRVLSICFAIFLAECPMMATKNFLEILSVNLRIHKYCTQKNLAYSGFSDKAIKPEVSLPFTKHG